MTSAGTHSPRDGTELTKVMNFVLGFQKEIAGHLRWQMKGLVDSGEPVIKLWHKESDRAALVGILAGCTRCE